MQRWLTFAGFLLALEGLALIVLILLSQTGVTEVSFRIVTLRVLGHPDEVVVNELPFSGLAIYFVLAPVAVFSAASGLRLLFRRQARTSARRRDWLDCNRGLCLCADWRNRLSRG